MDDSAAVSQGYSTLLQFGSQLFLYGYDDTALTKTTKKYCGVLNRYTLHTRYRILCGQVIRSKLRLRQLSCEPHLKQNMTNTVTICVFPSP